MSGLLVIGAGALGLAWLSQPEKVQPQEKAKEMVMGADDPVQTDFQITGSYGDIKDIAWILQYPGTVQEIKTGQDLSGTPCRWLRLRSNNCWYRTYNMTEEYCMAPPRK